MSETQQVHIHIHMYMCIHIRIYVCIYIHTCTIYKYVSDSNTYVHTYNNMWKITHFCTCTCVHTCTQTLALAKGQGSCGETRINKAILTQPVKKKSARCRRNVKGRKLTRWNSRMLCTEACVKRCTHCPRIFARPQAYVQHVAECKEKQE